MCLQPTEIAFLQEQIAFKRDERAYKRLFFIFYKPLLRFASGYVKNPEASEEIVSDILMKVWTMKEALGSVGNLKVYLYRSIKNSCINYLSATGKYEISGIENAAPLISTDMYNPEEAALSNELKREIAAAINELPPKCRLVYKLIREDGLSYREVAVILNISVNTVDRHLNNALHKLVKAVKVYLL